MKTGKTPLALLCVTIALCGCKPSAYIQTTIENDGPQAVRLVEMDYPSASFGVQQIAPHTSFHYHFKVQGSGQLSLTFTGAGNKVFTVAGPAVRDGDQGALAVVVNPAGQVSWNWSGK